MTDNIFQVEIPTIDDETLTVDRFNASQRIMVKHVFSAASEWCLKSVVFVVETKYIYKRVKENASPY